MTWDGIEFSLIGKDEQIKIKNKDKKINTPSKPTKLAPSVTKHLFNTWKT